MLVCIIVPHKLNDLKLSQKKKALNMEIHFLLKFMKIPRSINSDVEKSKLIDKAIDLGLEVCKTCPAKKCEQVLI